MTSLTAHQRSDTRGSGALFEYDQGYPPHVSLELRCEARFYLCRAEQSITPHHWKRQIETRPLPFRKGTFRDGRKVQGSWPILRDARRRQADASR